MNLFLDLDGTLFDSRKRLFNLFSDLTSQTLLSFEDYWELKRNMHNHAFILTEFLAYAPEEIDIFSKNWMQLIESEKYLDDDFPFEYTIPTLTRFKEEGHKINLITARQSKIGVQYQLDKYKMTFLFDELYITENKKSKIELLQDAAISTNTQNIICGDTGLDILTGKAFGMKTYAVLSGFRSKPFLKKYSPDFIINDIIELYEANKH